MLFDLYRLHVSTNTHYYYCTELCQLLIWTRSLGHPTRVGAQAIWLLYKLTK